MKTLTKIQSFVGSMLRVRHAQNGVAHRAVSRVGAASCRVTALLLALSLALPAVAETGEIVIHEGGSVTYAGGSADRYSGGNYYAITKPGDFGEEVSGIRTEGNVANDGTSITFTGVRVIDNGASTLKISSVTDGIAVTNVGWIGAINQQSSNDSAGSSDLDVTGIGDIIVKSTASGKGAKGIGAYSAKNPDITQNKINVQAKSLTVEADGTAYGIQGTLAGRTTTVNIENAMTVKGVGSAGKAYLSNLTQATPLGKATLNFGSVSSTSENSMAYGFHDAGSVDADITLNGDMTVVGSTYGIGFRLSGAADFDVRGADGNEINITVSSTSNYSQGADVGNGSSSTAKLNLDVNNFTVASENAEAYGLYAEASKSAAIVADVNNLSVSAGTDAYAIYTEGGAVTILNSAIITAQGGTSSNSVCALAGATVTFSNSVTLVGDVTNAGTIAIGVYAGKPSINLTGAFANTGTLAVDMTGATEDSYTIVSATAASDYGTVKITGAAYVTKVVGNDLYAVKPDLSKLYVNATWTEESALPEGLGWGLNAFATIQGAVNAADVSAGAVTVSVAAGTYNGDVALSGKSNLVYDDGTKVGRIHFIADGTGETIVNGKFTFGNDSIKSQDICDVQVTGFTFNNVDYPIYIMNSGTASKDIVVTDNKITLDAATGKKSYGPVYVNSKDVDGVTVTGNSISGATMYAMSFGGSSGTINNVTVSNNTIASSSAIGIFGQIKTGGVTVSGNTFNNVDFVIWTRNSTSDANEGTLTLRSNAITGCDVVIAFRGKYAKTDIVIGDGNTVDGVVVTGWADPEAEKYLVHTNAYNNNGVHSAGKIYVGGETAFTTVREAYDAAPSDDSIIIVGSAQLKKSEMDFSTLVVNGDWSSKSTGDAITVGEKTYYYGVNAFSNMDDTIAAMDATTATISLQGNATLGDTEKMYLKHDLVIEGNGYTINRVVSGTDRLDFEILVNDAYDLTYKATFDNVIFKGLTPNMSGVFYMSTKVDVTNNSLIDVYQLYTYQGTTYVDATSKLNTETSSSSANKGEDYQVRGKVIIAGSEEFDPSSIKTSDNNTTAQLYTPYISLRGASTYECSLNLSNANATAYTKLYRNGDSGSPRSLTLDHSLLEVGRQADGTWLSNPVPNGVGFVNFDEAGVTTTITNGSIFRGSTYLKNAGTFTVSGSTVEFGTTIENSGTMTLENAKLYAGSNFAVGGGTPVAGDITNSGELILKGTKNSIGVYQGGKITNTGTITVSGAKGDTSGLASILQFVTWENGSTLSLVDNSSITMECNFANNISVESGSYLQINGNVTLDAGESITLGYNADDSTLNVGGTLNASAGSITVDMTGATEDEYTIIFASDEGTSEYGSNLSVTGGAYTLSVEDNCLFARKAVASMTFDGKTTYYDTFAKALAAAQAIDVSKRAEKNSVIVTICADQTVAGADFNGDNTGITIVGEEGSTITGDFGATGASCVLKNTTFKGLNFVGGKITFSTNVKDYTGFTIDGCTMDGTGAGTTNPSAITINRNDTVCADGIQVINNKIKNYSATNASGIIIGNSNTIANDVVVSGNTIENVYFNAMQVFACKDAVISNNTVQVGETSGVSCGSNALNLLNTSATIVSNVVTLTNVKKSFIANANNLIKISGGNSLSASDLTTPLTDPKAIVQYSTWGTKDPYYNDKVIFVTDKTEFDDDGKIIGGDVFASEAKLETVLKNAKQFEFLNGLDSNTLVYVTDVANNVCEISGPVQGTVKVPDGYTFTLTKDTTFTEGTKLYVPYAQGSEALSNWIASNIPAEQAANVTVAGFVAAIGTTNYYTLQEALTAVKADETVKLLCNLTDAAAVTAPALAFNLDLAGFNYTNWVQFVTQSGNTITLTDSTEPAVATTFSVNIAGTGTLKIDSKANVVFNCSSNASIDNSGKLSGDNFYLNNSLISDGTLNMKNGKITVEDSATMPIESDSYNYKNGIKLQGSATLTNATITETFADNLTWYRTRGIYALGTDTEITFVSEAGKTTSIAFDRDKTRTKSQTGWSYGIALGDGSDNASIMFAGAGDLCISGNQKGGGDANSTYGWSINGIRVNGPENKLTFANEGKTTITESAAYGVNGVVNTGTTSFTNGTVLINTYIDGGVGFSNNIGLFNSYGKINVTGGVDEMTVFTEGAAYVAAPESGDISEGAAAIFNGSYNDGKITINAKKLNVLAVSGEDTTKEWTIGGTTVIGHTTYSEQKAAAVGEGKYSTSFGIKNEGMDTITVGADTVTTIHTRDFHKNSVAVGAVAYWEGSYVETNGGIELLGDTTIIAEGSGGTKALYAMDGNFITIGSAGKMVDVTGDIYAANKGLTTDEEGEELPSTITLAGDANTVAGSLTVTNGAVVNLDNTVLSGTAGSVFANSTLNLFNTTLKVATFVNQGTVTNDLAGFTGASFTIVEITSPDAKTLEDFGTVVLVNAPDYHLEVVDNDLCAVLNAAQVISLDGATTNSFLTLAGAFAAVQNGETIRVLKDNDEVVSVPPTATRFSFDANGKTLTGDVATADGYAFVPNGEGGCEYGTIVAKNASTPYLSLVEAIADANDGDRVMLLRDVAVDTAAVKPVIVDFGTNTVNGSLTVTTNVTLSGATGGLAVGDGTNAVTVAAGVTVKVIDGFYRVTDGNLFAGEGTAVLQGGTYSKDPSAWVDTGFEAVDNKDGTWTVGVKVETGSETKENEATLIAKPTTYSAETNDVPSEVKTKIEETIEVAGEPTTAAKEIAAETEVEGVRLTTAETTNVVETVTNVIPAGVQAVVDAAKVKAATDQPAFVTDIEGARQVEVKVDVKVTPTDYSKSVPGSSVGVAAFALEPIATVTAKDENGTVLSTETGVKVTNDMIDPDQKIMVSIFTGFEPQTIVHVDDAGGVIEVFSAGQIVYNPFTGVAQVPVSHFSDLIATEAASVCRIVETGVCHPTLAAAFAQVAADQTVQLLCNVNESVAATSPTVDFTLDLASYDYANEQSLTVNGNVTVVGDGNNKFDFSSVYIYSSGTLTLANGISTSCSSLMNMGTIAVDVTDIAGCYKVIDLTGAATVTLADYGAVETVGFGSEYYTFAVEANDLWLAKTIAVIDEQKFLTVNDAIEAAVATDTIELYGAGTIASNTVLGAQVTLDVSDGSLTIPEDITLTVNGTLDTYDAAFTNKGVLVINAGSTYALEGENKIGSTKKNCRARLTRGSVTETAEDVEGVWVRIYTVNSNSEITVNAPWSEGEEYYLELGAVVTDNDTTAHTQDQVFAALHAAADDVRVIYDTTKKVYRAEKTYKVTIDGVVATNALNEAALSFTAPIVNVTNGWTNVVCTGWTGSTNGVAVAALDPATTVAFKITADSVIDWHYQTNYWFTAKVAEGSAGTIVATNITVQPNVAVDISGTWANTDDSIRLYATPAEHYHFKQWNMESRSFPSNPLKADMYRPYAFTAEMPIDTFKITIDGAVATNIAWGATYTATSPMVNVTNAWTNIVCTGWTGNTNGVAASGTEASFEIKVDKASTFNWLYQTNWCVNVQALPMPLTVSNTTDGVEIPLVSFVKDGDSVLARTVAIYTNAEESAWYKCLGSDLTGEGYLEGPVREIGTLTAPAWITWNVETNFLRDARIMRGGVEIEKFLHLKDAIASDLLQNGDTIELLRDAKVVGGEQMITKSITLDLNGWTIVCTNETTATPGAALIVGNGTTAPTVTLKDSVGTGKVTGGKNAWRGGGVWVWNGNFIFESGTIEGNTYYAGDDPDAGACGGAIFVNAGSTATMKDGAKVIANESKRIAEGEAHGGAFGVAGTLIIDGGLVSNNTAKTSAGFAYVLEENGNKGKLIINGGTIVNNTPDGDNALVTVGGATAVINAGTFSFDPSAWTPATSCGKQIEANRWTVVPAVARIGERGYLTLKDAVAALTGGEKIVLLQGTTTDGITLEKSATIDINGQNLTNGTCTVSNALTIVNGVAAGGLFNEGTVTVWETLDMSALTWGVGGFQPGTKGALAIKSAGTVKMGTTDGKSPNWMAKNMPSFLAQCETGATLVIGEKSYTKSANGLWTIADAVATAEILAKDAAGTTDIEYLDSFATLQDAADAVKENGAVTLVCDVEVDTTVTFAKAATLDLAQKEFASSCAGFALMAQNAMLTVSNGTITAAGRGIKADDASGLTLAKVELTAQNRAIQLSNLTGAVVPGALTIDADSTVSSEDECAILCGNGNSTSARTVSIAGTVDAGSEALTLSGNNTAVIDGDLSTTNKSRGAIYYGGTWGDQKGLGAGTRPTLTINGTVTSPADALGVIWNDYQSGDKVGVNLTINSEDAEIIGGTYGIIFQAPGSVNISAGTVEGQFYVGREYEDMSVSISGGTFGSVASDPHSAGTYPALTGFITGGTFGADPTDYCAEGYFGAKEGELWYVVSGPEAKIGEKNYYLYLEDALKAADDGETVTALKDGISVTNALAIAKTLTFDINGFEVTLTSVVVNANATLKNAKIGQDGWLKLTGPATVNAGCKLDMSQMPMGESWGGIHHESVLGGGFDIQAGGEVLFLSDCGAYKYEGQDYASPNFMVANLPGTFGRTFPVSGAKVSFTNGKLWTSDGTYFVLAGAQAKIDLKDVATVGSYIGQSATCDFTESYATLKDAVAAATDDALITLTAAASADEIATAKDVTLDLNGQMLTLNGSKTLTLGADTVVTNGAAGGGLTINGTVTVNGSLDFSTLKWGDGGLKPDCAGNLSIGGTSSVKFWAGNDPTDMEANKPGFLSSSSDGARFVSGEKTYTYGHQVWAEGERIAVAKIGNRGYGTLTAAFEAVRKDQTIEILEPCEGEGLSVAENAFTNVTVNFAGFTYTATNATPESEALSVAAGNSLVFTNGTLAATKGTQLVGTLGGLTFADMILNSGSLVTALVAKAGSGTTLFYNTTINGAVGLAGGNVTFVSGALSGELVDQGIGSGVVLKAADYVAVAPETYAWLDVEDNMQRLIKAPVKIVTALGTTYYSTLSNAVVAATNVETITMCENVSEDIVLNKHGDLMKITAGGEAWYYSGKVTTTVPNAAVLVTDLAGGITQYQVKHTVSVEPQTVDHTEFEVTYTNVVQELPFRAFSNDTVTVKYTVSNGWFFAGGETTYTTDYTADKDPALIPEAQLPKVEQAVAKVVGKTSETYYYTLVQAIKAAQDGETVALVRDAQVVGGQQTITKNITFDLCGHSVIATNEVAVNTAVLDIGEGWTGPSTLAVTLKDSVGGGKVTGGKDIYRGAGVCVRYGSFTFESGTIEGNTYYARDDESAVASGGALFVCGGATATMKDGAKVLSNTATTAEGEDARQSHGGAFGVAGTLNLEGGVYSNNMAVTSGAVAYVINGGQLNVNGGLFVENYVSNNTLDKALSLFATQSAAATCSVSNGWFDVDPWNYAAPGRASVYIAESNLWTMADAVCTIDDHRYFSISNAIELSASPDDLIELVTDCDEDVVLRTLGQSFNLATNTFAFTGTVTTPVDGAIVHVEPQDAYTTYRVMMPVAKIGTDQKFAYLHEAFEAAQDGETVTLIEGCSNETSYAVAKAITLDENGFEATNVCIAATGTVAIKGATGSANKLRVNRPTLFGTLKDGAKVFTDKTYVYCEAIDAFYEEGHEVVATTYSAYGEYLETYAKFADGFEAVATNGTIYTIKRIIETDGFVIDRSMTIDLKTGSSDPDVNQYLVVTNCGYKKMGIYVSALATNVTIYGGSCYTLANGTSGMTTLVGSDSPNFVLDANGLQCNNLANNPNLNGKTVSALAVSSGSTILTNTAYLICGSARDWTNTVYVLQVNCYGLSKGTSVTMTPDSQAIGPVLVNAQNKTAPLSLKLGEMDDWAEPEERGKLYVNAYNQYTTITKPHGTDPRQFLVNDEFVWQQTSATTDTLVLGRIWWNKTQGTYAATLQAAYDAASADDTLVACADDVVAGDQWFKRNTTLDLNGHTLTVGNMQTNQLISKSTLTIVGTNANSRLLGRLYVSASALVLRGGVYECADACTITVESAGKLDIADAIISCDATNDVAVQIGNPKAVAYSSPGAQITIRNSRLTGYSAAYIGGGQLTISNSVLTATGAEKLAIDRVNCKGGTGDALVIDQKKNITVDIQAGSKLFAAVNSTCDQFGWYKTSKSDADKASATKYYDVDLMAPLGYAWYGDTNTTVRTLVRADGATPVAAVDNLGIARNTLDLTYAYDVTVAGEQITIKPNTGVTTPVIEAIELLGSTVLIRYQSTPDFYYEVLESEQPIELKSETLSKWTILEKKRARDEKTTFTTTKKDNVQADFYTVRCVEE